MESLLKKIFKTTNFEHTNLCSVVIIVQYDYLSTTLDTILTKFSLVASDIVLCLTSQHYYGM